MLIDSSHVCCANVGINKSIRMSKRHIVIRHKRMTGSERRSSGVRGKIGNRAVSAGSMLAPERMFSGFSRDC